LKIAFDNDVWGHLLRIFPMQCAFMLLFSENKIVS